MSVSLVLGGARSGKSAFAEKLCIESGLSPVYLATGQAFDAEMRGRIAAHRAGRSEAWRTAEAPLDLVFAIRTNARRDAVILVDCLTLWLSNLMGEERDVEAECDGLADLVRTGVSGRLVLVSNEVGLGIVPDNAAARAFRDHAGRLHQAIAAAAGEVFFVAAGLPLKLKG